MGRFLPVKPCHVLVNSITNIRPSRMQIGALVHAFRHLSKRQAYPSHNPLPSQ